MLCRDAIMLHHASLQRSNTLNWSASCQNANKGQDGHEKILEILFLQSVIHLSLLERHKILSNMLADPPAEGVQLGRSSVFGRAFALVPYRQFLNGMPVSKVSQSEEDIQEAFDSAVKGQVVQQILCLSVLLSWGITCESCSGEFRVNRTFVSKGGVIGISGLL